MESQNQFQIQLEHGMGYNGLTKNSLILHPNLVDYIYIAGGVIVIAEMNDPNKQKLLRCHDDVVTCISLSHNGELLASGQKGKNSDIFVWDYKTGNVIYNIKVKILSYKWNLLFTRWLFQPKVFIIF